jgi:hypothetical protein
MLEIAGALKHDGRPIRLMSAHPSLSDDRIHTFHQLMAASTGDGGLRASAPIASCESSSVDAGQQPPRGCGPPGADREANVLIVSGVVARGSSVPSRRSAASTISAGRSERLRPGMPPGRPPPPANAPQ